MTAQRGEPDQGDCGCGHPFAEHEHPGVPGRTDCRRIGVWRCPCLSYQPTLTAAQRGHFDRPPTDRVTVSLPAEDVAFLRGFDPDRDRTASRADMVRVIEHLQAALVDQPAPGADTSGQAVQRVLALADPGDPDARMDAYYYGFERTGVGIVDGILSAVAQAGKSYHSTDMWAEEDEWTKPSHEARIQAAAELAATRIRDAVAGPQRDHGEQEQR